ncbi:MAG TPA: hypothetical protein PLF01_02550 [Alphaproteobacteria bacterium]|nr:hypothetical protein [Alphaproteobacteria bacterium]
MTKTIMVLSAMGLLGMGLVSTPAMAQDDVTAAGEELVETTQDMATEAEDQFDQAVDCADVSMSDDGTEPSVDCVSKPDDVEQNAQDEEKPFMDDETITNEGFPQ